MQQAPMLVRALACLVPHKLACSTPCASAGAGIAVGGAVILVLLLALLFWAFGRVSSAALQQFTTSVLTAACAVPAAQPSSPVVVDDYQWAAQYAHTINTQQQQYYASQLKGSAYALSPAKLGNGGAYGQ